MDWLSTGRKPRWHFSCTGRRVRNTYAYFPVFLVCVEFFSRSLNRNRRACYSRERRRNNSERTNRPNRWNRRDNNLRINNVLFAGVTSDWTLPFRFDRSPNIFTRFVRAEKPPAEYWRSRKTPSGRDFVSNPSHIRSTRFVDTTSVIDDVIFAGATVRRRVFCREIRDFHRRGSFGFFFYSEFEEASSEIK